MPDGGSQSPITLRLNSLAGRRLANPRVAQAILDRLLGPDPLEEIAARPIDGTVIARRMREQDHIRFWPQHQKVLLRAVVTEAVRQRRQVAYDWQEDTTRSIHIVDDGTIIGVTFRSPVNDP